MNSGFHAGICAVAYGGRMEIIMKKLLALLLILAISAFACFSCTPPDDPNNPDDPGIEGGGGNEDGPNIDPDGWTQS